MEWNGDTEGLERCKESLAEGTTRKVRPLGQCSQGNEIRSDRIGWNKIGMGGRGGGGEMGTCFPDI